VSWKKHETNAKAVANLQRKIGDDHDNNTTEDPDSWTIAELKARNISLIIIIINKDY
jgi:hypothetical protein